MGLIVVLIFPGGPFNLKLTPNNPSPYFFWNNNITYYRNFASNLLSVFAGTNVPLKLVNPFLS